MLVSVSTALPDTPMPCSPPCSLEAALPCPAIINLMLTASIPCLKMAASRTPARRPIPASPPCWDTGACKTNPCSPAALRLGKHSKSCGHSQQGWHSKRPAGQHSQSQGLEMLCLLPTHFAGQILPQGTPARPRLGTQPSSASTLLQIKLATYSLPLTQKSPSRISP